MTSTKLFTIATRGGMKLYEADCHLEYARLYLAEGDKEKAKEHLSTAKKMIEEMGYHRRDIDIEAGYARLYLAEGDKVKAKEHLINAKKIVSEKGLHAWDKEIEDIEKQL